MNSSPADLSTDAKAFQYKSDADASGVNERLQGIKRWDPVKAGIGIVYERKDGTRVIADGHQRLGLAKRLASEGQKPAILGRLYREADGFTVADIRRLAARKNIAEGTGNAFDAATVLRDSPDIEADLAELPPRSSLVRNAANIALLDDEPFAMAKASTLPAEQIAVVGRVAEGDGPLQEALIKEFLGQKPPNVAQAETMARMFKEDRTENESIVDLFGEQEVATSFYRERAQIVDRTIKRLKQDKRVFATLDRHAKQIEGAGNVLAGENEEIAETAGRAAFLVQRLATRAGPVADVVKEAARKASETGQYTPAVNEVVAAVQGWAEAGGGSEIGGQADLVKEERQMREGRDAGEAVPRGREEAPADDQDLDIDIVPTAAELEAAGQKRHVSA